jgi:hypothetical protein
VLFAVLKSRRSVGVADASFYDSADGISELPDTIDLAHKHKVSGAGEATMDDLEFGSQTFMMSAKDDGFLFPGSSKLHESTSEGTAVFRNDVTSKASGR